MPKSKPKPKAKPHDPTPEERDERHKIEGHTFEQAMGVILKAPPKVEQETPSK
jgi:hypothetical protein